MHITFNISSIRKKLDVIDAETRLFAQHTYYKAMDGYIPFESGMLQKNVFIDETGVLFVSEYSRYLYMGKVMVDSESGKGPAFILGVGFRFRKGATLRATERDLTFNHEVKPLACAGWGNAAWLGRRKQIAQSVENYIKSKKGGL